MKALLLHWGLLLVVEAETVGVGSERGTGGGDGGGGWREGGKERACARGSVSLGEPLCSSCSARASASAQHAGDAAQRVREVSPQETV